MRNAAMEQLDPFVGTWDVTLTNAWFLEPGTIERRVATVEWIGDAFITMRCPDLFDLVFGRSDANDAYHALYWDDRGVCRRFDMTFDGVNWVLNREDPDFHQRLVMRLNGDRIEGQTDASEDFGINWRKDFDVLFERR